MAALHLHRSKAYREATAGLDTVSFDIKSVEQVGDLLRLLLPSGFPGTIGLSMLS